MQEQLAAAVTQIAELQQHVAALAALTEQVGLGWMIVATCLNLRLLCSCNIMAMAAMAMRLAPGSSAGIPRAPACR
jgi:hypothetical protein